jgi:glucan 1,3-beta-glucosidase
LPIGYWAWDVSQGEYRLNALSPRGGVLTTRPTIGEPYIQGQLAYLDTAVNWAGQYGLKIIVDLHGAPGSQNAFDNSGQRLNYPTWHTQSGAVARTDAIIKTLAEKFMGNPTVVPIIAPLNEPAGFYQEMMGTIKQYWYDSFTNVRFPYGGSQQVSLCDFWWMYAYN